MAHPRKAPLDDAAVQRLMLGRWFDTPANRRPVGYGSRKAMRLTLVDSARPPALPPAAPPAAPPAGYSDSQGLDAAYASDHHVVVSGDTLIISGTKHTEALIGVVLSEGATLPYHLARGDLQDVIDDVTKIPSWGDTRSAQRYRDAEPALLANPQVTRVVGHSLGGSVTLELAKRHPGLNRTTVT